MRFFLTCTSRIILNKHSFGGKLTELVYLFCFVGLFSPQRCLYLWNNFCRCLVSGGVLNRKVCPERMTGILQSVAISRYDLEISYHYRMNESLFLTVRKKDHVKHTGKVSMKYESWKSVPALSIMYPWQMPKYNSWEAQKLVGLHTSIF